MDYLERKYRGKRKENIVNAIYLVAMAVTVVAAGLLIYGYLKTDIFNRNIMYFVTFFSAFIMCVTLAVKSKMKFKYERMIWLIIQSIVLLMISIVMLVVLL